MTTQLEVIYRLEPGCLGPEGAVHIEDFCRFAQPMVEAQAPAFMRWQLTPRFDKKLPELQFMFNGRSLTEPQAERLLASYHIQLDDLVEELNQNLTFVIDQYFGRW